MLVAFISCIFLLDGITGQESFALAEIKIIFLTFFQGGILWFQNLTEIPHGALGCIFPLLIGVLHYTNIQVLRLLHL